MAGLYRKVLKGQYSKIPDHFSADLAGVLAKLVQVQPALRPTCDEILELPAVKKMGERLFPDFYEEEAPHHNQLLSTIRVPKNLLYLTDRLPKPSYEDSRVFNKRVESIDRKRTETNEDSLPQIHLKEKKGRNTTKDT